jgi:integrase
MALNTHDAKKLPSKFIPLYDNFKECRDWVKDLSDSFRNRRTARDYAEAFAQFVEFAKKSPSELARLEYERAYDLMRKFALWRIREVGVSPKRVHTQWFALVSFFRFHRIVGDFDFPSRSIPVVVKYLDRIPTKGELSRILNAPRLDISTKIGIHLMAYAGIRPEDVCALTYSCIREDFERGITPCAVWIPQGKTGLAYVTFIPAETVELLKQYFERRSSVGERIGADSPIIVDWIELRKSSKVKRIQRKSLCIRITKAMRHSGVRVEEQLGKITRKMRPYSLRKYFRSNLTGHMPTEYIEAMLGHTSGLEHVYGGTRDLDPATIGRMREAYKKSEPFLSAAVQLLDQSAVVKEAKIEALKSISKNLLGIDLIEVKIAKEKELSRELSKEEELELFENELKKLRDGRHNPQTIVKEGDLETYLKEGWQFVSVLPSQKILIRR